MKTGSIITILPANLQNELDVFGFTQTVPVDEGAAYDYFAKNGKISIETILKRHNFQRIEGVQILSDFGKKFHKGKTELAVEIYQNSNINAFFSIIEDADMVDVKPLHELYKYIKAYSIILKA